ncbi:MAG TPA: TIM-barrel domain-containing protein [Rhizomicrobium sp.]
MRGLLCVLVSCLLVAASRAAEAPAPGHWSRIPDGVLVTPAKASAQPLRLKVMGNGLLHVTVFPSGELSLPKSLMVVATPEGRFAIRATPRMLTVKTSKAVADIRLTDGRIVFRNAAGRPVLSEHAHSFRPVQVEGRPYWWVREEFNRGTDEGFYGLGQHQNRQMNYNGEDVVLAQHNMDVAVPLVVSTRNYGVLWDNYSITRFGDAREYEPIDASLALYDANGNRGGLTARYYSGDTLKVTRIEADPNYQYIKDQVNWPAEVKGDKNRHVVWEGKVESGATGVHKFRLYISGTFKLFVDGKPIIDGWRQGWQGWYRNFDLPMTAGVPQTIRLEWTPQDGYMRLLHLAPLPPDERRELSLSSAVGRAIDYYFIGGRSMDDVIAGYRKLTGKAVMLPRWAYGFWQSRQRYESQDQLLSILHEYRKQQLPLDSIVQDWLYWKEDQWGSHEFDPARFPDPAAMVREVHANDAHIMISVWPKFYPKTANYNELDAKGHIYRGNIEMGNKDWVGPGYLNSNYDPYSREARDIYWRQIRNHLDVLGFDAYWLDNDEPDTHSNLSIPERMYVMGPTAMGPAAEFFNTFPLLHVGGVYDHWHADHPNKRLVLLTRSGFGGLQRYSAAVWSGDIVSRWSDMRDQISAGVNFSLSGIPNWSFDIGGYTMEDRFWKPTTPEDDAEWKELYTRWFEFGAFVPIFRSHGELRHREIFEISPPGSEIYNILADYDRLRYRLMPYIYTVAADLYQRDSTMMRGLAMDFAADRNVWNIDNEYMFGPAFLVAPVTEYRARERAVYLPAGTDWYDFHTGKRYSGGQTVTVDAPLAQMPLFVRAGSIVPTGPEEQYTGENSDTPITLLIYPGANGHFDLYGDDGVSLDYTRGAFTYTPISYNNVTGTVRIGALHGSYPGMARSGTINIRWMDSPMRGAGALDGEPGATVRYTGKAVSMRRPPRFNAAR